MMQPRQAVDFRTRLIERNRTRRQQAIDDRIAEADRDSHRLLLQRAHQLQMSAEVDYRVPGAWQTRQRTTQGGYERYRLELTTRTSCSCQEFSTWHRCPHVAFVIDLTSAIERIAA